MILASALVVPVQAADGPLINTENEPSWSTGYVLQRYSGGVCEPQEVTLRDDFRSLSDLLQTRIGDGGENLEQVPTPPHPVPLLDQCETCVWQCVGGPVQKTCLNPEWVCNFVAVTAGAAVGAHCAVGSGPGAAAVGAACGFASGSAVKKVCGWVLKERFCTEWDPCREHKKVCTDNC